VPAASRRVRIALVVLALAAGAAGLAGGALRGGLSFALESPEARARAAAAALAGTRALDAGPARLELEELRLAEIAVAVDGPRARVVAVAEGGGRARFAGQAPTFAYVGREAFLLERCAGAGFCPAEAPLPALRGVVAALAGAPRAAGTRVLAWQIRVERDRATAGEDLEVADGAAVRRLREVRALRREADGGWALAAP
jgi:hypothetical protein